MKTCKWCGKSGGKFHGRICYQCHSKRTTERAKEASRRAVEWQRNNPERRREIALSYYYRTRNQAFDAYGWKCECCGETEPCFLTIDHVNGGGNKHRREMFGKSNGGTGFYKLLRDLGYPKEFRTLCMNCNHGRMRNGGICPHQLGVTTIPKGSRAKRPEAHSPSKLRVKR